MSFSLFIWELIYFCMRFSRYIRFLLKPSGDNEIRTRDLLLARQALSQLSYTPGFHYLYIRLNLMGLSGLEPPTSRLSGVRSNRLSYKPILKSGGHLLSHTVSSAVPSAVWVLTIVFGMGTGVSLRRIATRYIQLSLDNLTINNNPYFFFRFSWIDSAACTTYFIHLP